MNLKIERRGRYTVHPGANFSNPCGHILFSQSFSLVTSFLPHPLLWWYLHVSILWSFLLLNHLLGLLTSQPCGTSHLDPPCFYFQDPPGSSLLRELCGILMTKICSVIFRRLDFLSSFCHSQAVWYYAKYFTSWKQFPFYRMKLTSVLLSGRSSKYKIIMQICVEYRPCPRHHAECFRHVVPLTLWCWN